MPAGPGESLLTTLFADIHYYFNDPSSRPPHHRFDRGSYVYLFFNAVQRQAKLEIANHAGTPDQDAFHGYLNVANIRYNHLQPTLFTININTVAVPDQTTWHLPSLNERNEQKYLYKLNTLDLYFWTEKDAAAFLSHLKSSLTSDKIEIKNAPAGGALHAEHRDSMSPVVQQLEKTAIGTPYQQRASSVVSAQSFPGPPTPASAGSPKAAPMAYNPAAPAAPEPVSYREKTPPPPDDGSGTGLTNAARYENAPQPQYGQQSGTYQNSNQTTPQTAYFSGPPSRQQSFPGPPSGAPTPQAQQRQPSFGPMAASTLPQSPPPHQQSFQRQSSTGTPGPTQYANYNPQPQYANYPGTPGYNPNVPPTPSAPPAYSAGPLQSPGMPPPPPQQHQPQHQAPVGGYSHYDYSATQASQAGSLNAHGGYTGDMHSQVYRPTEAEASSHHSKPRKTKTGLDGKEQPKLTENFGNLESKVGKYLNKLDKLW